MRLVDSKEFLEQPEGTMYCAYSHMGNEVGPLIIKGETAADGQPAIHPFATTIAHGALNFVSNLRGTDARDVGSQISIHAVGVLDSDELGPAHGYIIFSQEDLKQLADFLYAAHMKMTETISKKVMEKTSVIGVLKSIKGASLLKTNIVLPSGRLYPPSVIKDAFAKIAPRIAANTFVGVARTVPIEAEASEDSFLQHSSIDVSKVSHRVTALFERPGGWYADFDILDTPEGRKLAELLDDDIIWSLRSLNGLSRVAGIDVVTNAVVVTVDAFIKPPKITIDPSEEK